MSREDGTSFVLDVYLGSSFDIVLTHPRTTRSLHVFDCFASSLEREALQVARRSFPRQRFQLLQHGFRGARHATVIPDDHGTILQIVAWFLMVLMILSIFLRVTIRLTTTHIPGTDDAVVLVAMVSEHDLWKTA